MSDGDEITFVDSEGEKIAVAKGDEYEILDEEGKKEYLKRLKQKQKEENNEDESRTTEDS